MKLYSITRSALCLVLIAGLATVSSCKKDFGDINDRWDNQVFTATVPQMFNGVASTLTEPGRGLFSSFLYHATQLAANYSASGYRLDNTVGGIWENYYFALADYRRTLELIEADPEAQRYTNIKAMLEAIMAYKTLRTTTLFGDMPYTEAGRSFEGTAHYRPVYNDQASIFTDALEKLKWAVDNLSTSSDQISLGNFDVVFQNDIDKWTKFANSMRLRYAMVMREKNASAADAIIAEALTKPLLGPDEFIGVDPKTVPTLILDRGPAFRGNAYVRMGSTMWNAMSTSDDADGSGIFDLRTEIFFEPNSDGDWAPYPQAPPAGTPAENTNANGSGGEVNDPYAASRLTTWDVDGFYLYSPLNVYYVNDQTFPDLLITGSEVSFLLAEIYNRGIGGVSANAATAQQHYEAGITSSVNFWYDLAHNSTIWIVNKPAAAPTPGELSDMLTHPRVAYSSDPAEALSQIYAQHWIALFHQPFDAWTLQRRTNYGTPNVPLAPTSESLNMHRLIYPPTERDSNFENWLEETGGTDDMTRKPWFMP